MSSILPKFLFLADLLLAPILSGQVTAFKAISRYPRVLRDLAVIVDDSVAWQQIVDAVISLSDTRIQSVELFDVYRGTGVPEGRQSLALSLSLCKIQKRLWRTLRFRNSKPGRSSALRNALGQNYEDKHGGSTHKSRFVRTSQRCRRIKQARGRKWSKSLFDELSDSLISGDPVRLSGFGNFELRDKNERPGRNPKTGEEVPVSARRVVTFRAGQASLSS